MVQHSFKQFQNSFRSMMQICIADTLLMFESFDVFRNSSERFRTVPNYDDHAILNKGQNGSERFRNIKSLELFGTIWN